MYVDLCCVFHTKTKKPTLPSPELKSFKFPKSWVLALLFVTYTHHVILDFHVLYVLMAHLCFCRCGPAWSNGLAVKNVFCSYRGPEFSSQHPHGWLTTRSSSEEPDALLWTPCTTAHMWQMHTGIHIHTHTHTHTHKLKAIHQSCMKQHEYYTQQ